LSFEFQFSNFHRFQVFICKNAKSEISGRPIPFVIRLFGLAQDKLKIPEDLEHDAVEEHKVLDGRLGVFRFMHKPRY